MELSRQRPTLTKHAQASSDCMSTTPWGAPFSLLFQSPKNLTKHGFKKVRFKKHAPKLPQRAPPGSPKGDPNLSKIITKSYLNRHGCLPAPFRGYPPPTYTEKRQKKYRNLAICWQSMDTRSYSRGRFSRQSTGLLDLKNIVVTWSCIPGNLVFAIPIAQILRANLWAPTPVPY